MEVGITDRASAAVIAADAVAELLSRKPDLVIGIATGSTPLALYAELAARRTQGRLPGCARLTSFALDEYVGIDLGHPQSYHQVVAREWTAPLALRHDLVHVPSASAETLDTAGPRCEAAIRAAGGIDVRAALPDPDATDSARGRRRRDDLPFRAVPVALRRFGACTPG